VGSVAYINSDIRQVAVPIVVRPISCWWRILKNDPGSTKESGLPLKSNRFSLWPRPTPPENFITICTVLRYASFILYLYFANQAAQYTIGYRYTDQTVNDRVAHSKNPRKCAYRVTFDLDLDFEHTLDAGLPGDHRVQVWSRSGHLPGRRSDLRKSLQTDRRRTSRHCISWFLEWAEWANKTTCIKTTQSDTHFYHFLSFLAHSKNELIQWRGVRRLSVRQTPSVNFCANRFFSQANGRIATTLSQDGPQVSVHPGCAQGQGQGQRSRTHVIRELSWILGMSYSVIDGLVFIIFMHRKDDFTYLLGESDYFTNWVITLPR